MDRLTSTAAKGKSRSRTEDDPDPETHITKPFCFETLMTSFWRMYECKCGGDEDCKNCEVFPAAEREQMPKSPEAAEASCVHDTVLAAGSAENEVKPSEVAVNSLGNWDPQLMQYFSVLNIGDDNCDAEPIFKVLEKELPNLDQCPFDNGEGRCFKQRCFNTHRTPGHEPKIVEMEAQRGFPFTSLPTKRRPEHPGAIFWGYTTYALSPDEFFVLPQWDFRCECGRDTEVDNDNEKGDLNNFPTGKIGMDIVNNMLERYMKNQGKEVVHTSIYLDGEIVICRTSNGLARGVVLAYVDVSNEGGPDAVPLFLIDIGEIIELPYRSIFTVPQDLTKVQPLAYRCSLFGVTSIGFRYSERAKQFFNRLLVKNRNRVRIQVMGTPTIAPHNVHPFTEVKPYYVDLTVKFKNKQMRVADIMQDFGLTIQLNLYKSRPMMLNTGLIDMNTALLFKKQSPTKPRLQEYTREVCKEVAIRRDYFKGDENFPKHTNPEDIASMKQEEECLREDQLKKVVDGFTSHEFARPSSFLHEALENKLKLDCIVTKADIAMAVEKKDIIPPLLPTFPKRRRRARRNKKMNALNEVD